MKPYGREKNIQGSGKWKVDHHIHMKGYVNWWENMCDFLTRSRMKQINTKEIEEEVLDRFDGLDVCPKCGNKTLICTPSSRVINKWKGLVAHTYHYYCLDIKKCGYQSKKITKRINN